VWNSGWEYRRGPEDGQDVISTTHKYTCAYFGEALLVNYFALCDGFLQYSQL